MDELQQARVEIDAVDQEMARLFERRMAACRQVAQYKKERGLPILDANREAAVIERGAQRVEEPDLREYYICFLRDVMKTSRSYQSRLNEGMKVIYAGVEGAFGYIASKRAFPEAKLTAASDFTEAYRAVEAGEYDCAVLPIENSSAGSVTEVYDLMVRHKFYIVKSIKLHISHALLAKPGVKLEDVKEVVSHTQALQQCSNFLKANPNIKVTIFENTATAAKYVAESGRTDLAALSSTDCAKLYGLHVLQDGVQNNENNYTRFICIAKNMEIYAGSNRISLMLSLDHRPGSLHEMIGKFACRGINLCKLESRPIPGKDFEFRFYFDLDGSVFSPETMTVLKDIEQAAESLSFLGCYSEV